MRSNITGVTSFTQIRYGANPDYISVLVGRMLEKGLNPYETIQQINKLGKTSKIIAGSMRTVEQLRNVLTMGCVPTIGTSLFNELEKVNPEILRYGFEEEAIGLSSDFFNEMRNLSVKAYYEL